MNSESRQTVQYFCMMEATALGTVAANLSLSALVPHLPRVQHYYRTQEHRDPYRFELRLLETLASHANQAPCNIRISSLTANEELLRNFRDACHKWKVLGEHVPPSLYDLMGVSGRYLARSGITPHYSTFRVATHAQYALAAANSALTLSLSGTTATLSAAPMAPLPQAGALLLFSPAEHAAAAYADFLREHGQLGICPLAAVGKEGVLPHLLTTNGATLDLSPFMSEEATEIPTSLGVHTMLLAAPERALPELFAKGYPLSLLGTLNQSKKLTFMYHGGVLSSLSIGLLRTLRTEREQNVTHVMRATSNIAQIPCIKENADTLLGGIDVCANSASAVLTLATELARRGASFTDYSACAMLEYPTSAEEEHLGEALSLILGLHRATSELVLPTSHVALQSASVDRPRLSVYLAAKKGRPYPMEMPRDWQDARNHFYGD